ncbi:hypothetical protein [Streptomyces sp. NPDC057287]|uniref:hypothetical protein n=1 Tax=Streptomyces sp. NPDC057287 TaxID=3346086 RepID=UPI0036327568
MGEDVTLRVAPGTAEVLEGVTDQFSVALGGAFPPRGLGSLVRPAVRSPPGRTASVLRPGPTGPAGAADQMSRTR